MALVGPQHLADGVALDDLIGFQLLAHGSADEGEASAAEQRQQGAEHAEHHDDVTHFTTLVDPLLQSRRLHQQGEDHAAGRVDEDRLDAAATLFKVGDGLQHPLVGLAGQLFELAGLRHEGQVLAFGDGVELTDLGDGLLGLVAFAIDHGGRDLAHLATVDHAAEGGGPEGGQVIAGGQLLALGQPGQQGGLLRMLDPAGRGVEDSLELAGELAQHPEHLAHVAGTLAQGLGQLGQLLVVGIEGGLEPLTLGRFGSQFGLGLGQQGSLLVLVGQEAGFPLLVELGFGGAGGLDLIEQGVQIHRFLSGGHRQGDQGGTRDQRGDGKFDSFHDAFSAV